MLQCIARLLLVAALASSGAAAPFLHVHAHGPDHGASASHGEGNDEHCEHHYAEGVHWHVTEGPGREAGGALGAAGRGHRHAAVTLSVAMIEATPIDVEESVGPADVPAVDVQPGPRGVPTSVDPTAGPDPPSRAVSAARAPPVRS